MRMLQQRSVRTTKILRHIRVNRKKIVASIPIRSTISLSVVDHSGATQASTPLPSRGGACFSSACLSFGAYTTLLYGRRKEKHTAMAAVIPREEANAANTEFCCNWRRCRGQQYANMIKPFEDISGHTCEPKGFSKSFSNSLAALSSLWKRRWRTASMATRF